jgi:hypothetical protein
MTRTNWIAGTCLSLLLIGGAVLDARAQQPPAPPAPVETPQQPPAPQTPDSPPRPQMEPARPQTEYGGPTQTPPSGSQIDTRPAPLAGRDSGTFLGVDATLAMILGAVLVVVVVIGIVAMSRRGDEMRDPHRRPQA